MTTGETLSILRELAALCRQGERGYASAAEAVGNGPLRDSLRQYGRQRKRLASELEAHVHRLAGEQVPAAVRLFGAWADLATLGTRDDAAILAECARSEAITRERFERALDRDLPLNIRMVVHRQYTEIKASLQWLARAQATAAQHKHSIHGA